MFIGDGLRNSSATALPVSQDAVNEAHRKEQSAMADAIGKKFFIGEAAALLSTPSGGSWKGDFGKAAAGAGGAALDSFLELEISKHVNSQLAKDVFAPNTVESIGIGIAASRLPDKRLALAVAAGSWLYGRTENYFESKYHIEEKIGATGLQMVSKIAKSVF